MIQWIQRWMGVTPPALPLVGRSEVNGVDYEVETISRKETAISIHLPRHQMIVLPAYFRKDDETFCRDYRYGPLVDCLFMLGAAAIDIGTRDDKIAAIFHHKYVSLDKSAAEQVVAVLVNLRYQVLNSPPIAPPTTRPAAESTIEIDGQPVAMQLYAARIDTDADDGTYGNIDLPVTTKPAISPETILKHMCIRVPDYDELLEAPGYAPLDGGVELGFALLYLAAELGYAADQKRQDWLREMVNSIDHVDVVWTADGRRPLGTVPCTRDHPDEIDA